MVSFFGVQFTTLNERELGEMCLQALARGPQLRIATVNPEILLQAKSDSSFRELLNSFDARTIDGFGIAFLAFFLYGKRVRRLTGSQVVHIFASVAEQKHARVGVVGGLPGRSGKAAETLALRYPKATFHAIWKDKNFTVGKDGKPSSKEREFLEAVRDSQVDFLLVALGAPKQERLLDWLLRENPGIRAGVGIGGLVDVLAGEISHPPAVFRRLGIEWLWRLLQEPKRFTRIFRAVIVFPLTVLFTRIMTLWKK